MKKDYSEYQLSGYDRYRILRSNRKNVTLDYFVNTVRFFPENRSFVIRVDRDNEYYMMREILDEYDEDERKRRGQCYRPLTEDEEQEALELRESIEKENQQYLSIVQQKYRINFESYLEKWERYYAENPEKTIQPLINIFSGSQIEVNYGEGILDFVYADFITSLKPALKMYRVFEEIRKAHQEQDPERVEPMQSTRKVYNRTQEIVEDFLAYESSFNLVKETAYASLYSAICPPKFAERNDLQKELIWYGEYLMALQKE